MKEKHTTQSKHKNQSENITPAKQCLAQGLATLPPDERARLLENEQKIKAMGLEELRRRNFHGYLGTFASQDRYQPFLDLVPSLNDDEFWKLLGEVWTGLEEVKPDQQTWLRLFESKRPGREHLMSTVERTALAAMPDTIKIWRGCGHPDAVLGISWTLDKKVAEFFAGHACGRRIYYLTGRTGKTPIVAEATCRKADVLAYLTERKESDIVVNPKHVTVLRTYPGDKQTQPAIDPKHVAKLNEILGVNQ